MTDLAELTAVDLVAAFAAGEATPTEAALAALAAIERHDPDVHAMVYVDREAALRDAGLATMRWQEGAPLGPADGV
ncbi:MAG: amidase, partial [Nocardioides sp.]|nr:amidase [Nocardioides sp.]